MANIEVARLGDVGEIQIPMSLPLFVKKLLQDGFGVDANEFLAKSTIEDIDIARMDAKAVMDHREMMDAFGFETMDR